MNSSRPEPAFLNRNYERDLVARRVELLHGAPERLSVMELLGLAGSGTSRLLSELRNDVETGHFGTRQVAKISLEPQRSNTESGPLRALREGLSIDCMLFDTALLALLRAAGQPFQIERNSRLARSPVLGALGLEIGIVEARQLVGELSLSARFAVAMFDRLSRTATRLRRYKREEFIAIDDMRGDYGALLEHLPQFLGTDVRRALEASGDVLIVFYDSYENQHPDTLADGAPWLRGFIGAVGRGLHVIATCEPLRWPADVAGEAVEELPVGELPEQEARELLQARIGSVRPAIEGRVLEASERMPFFLETIGAEYLRLSADGAWVDVEDLPASSSEALPRLIKHLPREQRNLTIALAAIQVFDRELFDFLVRELHLQVDIFEFRPFTERFFVERIAHEPYELHKTHDLLTASVRMSGDEQVKLAALEQATAHLLVRCQLDGARSHQAVLALFLAIVAGWHASDTMPQTSVETLIDAGYLLYDSGYWNELASIATGAIDGNGRPVVVVCRFFAALATRRIVGIEHARERFRQLAPRTAVLGRHGRSVELEVAYLDELAGDYAGARKQFARLNPPVDDFDPHDRTQLRARLWHADMLIMDGALREGSRLLLEAYELLGEGAPLDWAELVRHRAHAFRYSFVLETAERLYRQAMRAVPKVEALQGKLETNLVETLCWCDPERALGAAERATAINGSLENRIELAKCAAARAIALARLGDFTPAGAALGAAREHASAVGYRAGTAFALQAEAVVAGLASDNDGLLDALGRLDDAVATLGTYGHLCVAPVALLADDTRLRDAVDEVEWLEREWLPQRLRTYLRPPVDRNGEE